MADWNWAQAAQGFIGAGPLGGLAGGFGGTGASEGQSSLTDRLGELERSYGGRDRGPVERAGFGDFRGNQQTLVDRLEAMSQGRGPSVAQANFQAATDRNAKSQQALAAGASGPNSALAQLQAAQGTANLGAQASQDLVAGRMAEQQAAIGQLGQVLHGARGQDQDVSMFNAGQGNQMSMFQRGLNDNSQLAALGMQTGIANQVAGQPGMGERILSGAAGLAGMATGNIGGAGAAGQPRPFQAPQPQQADPYQQWWARHGSPAGY